MTLFAALGWQVAIATATGFFLGLASGSFIAGAVGGACVGGLLFGEHAPDY